MSDRIRTAPDVPTRFFGLGLQVTARCDKCRQIGGTAGRKKVRGLWWCARCVEKRNGR